MHHSTAKGKRVRVKLRSGEVYIDRFVEKNRRFCITQERRTPWRDIANFTVLKPSEENLR